MPIFKNGLFTLSSGASSNFKIDCDSLLADEIECIAHLLSDRMKFGSVEGVPAGGIRLARWLQRCITPGAPLLIVDDVLTTGASMERHRAGRMAIGAVIFSRMAIPPSWIYPLFQLNTEMVSPYQTWHLRAVQGQ